MNGINPADYLQNTCRPWKIKAEMKQLKFHQKETWATCQNRTDISCLEGRHNNRYTNVAYFTQMCERTGTSGDFLRASDRTWTDNLLITNQLHHQLCYRGISTTFTVMWSTKTSSLRVVSNHNDKFICENLRSQRESNSCLHCDRVEG